MDAQTVSKRRLSGTFAAILAALFVLTLSVHNHNFNFDHGEQLSHSSEYSGHSTETCPACRLQGHIRLAHSCAFSGYIDSGIPLAFLTEENLIPVSFLKLQKPTRSPPAI
jgi:hypothetical protein